MSDQPAPTAAAQVRLYPVTIDLSCAEHGVEERITVGNLRGQRQWTAYYQDRHKRRHECDRDLVPLVVIEDA